MNRDGGDRGVSEVVGFVFVFGIIIGSVAMLSVVGFQLMEGYQENEQLRNAERGMTALANNFDDVTRYDGVDERSGELAIREGTVRTGSGGTVLNVTVDGEPVFEDSLGTFRYERGSTAIAYDGGGVFRAEESGDVSLSNPPLRCGDDVAVVSLVVIDAGDRTLRSDEVQEFTLKETNRTVSVGVEGTTVSVGVEETPYENGWESALRGENWSWDEGERTATCDVDRATVRIVETELAY